MNLPNGQKSSGLVGSTWAHQTSRADSALAALSSFEEGTEEFSNIHGLQQIRFSKGKIRETIGDVLAVLKRELG